MFGVVSVERGVGMRIFQNLALLKGKKKRKRNWRDRTKPKQKPSPT